MPSQPFTHEPDWTTHPVDADLPDDLASLAQSLCSQSQSLAEVYPAKRPASLVWLASAASNSESDALPQRNQGPRRKTVSVKPRRASLAAMMTLAFSLMFLLSVASALYWISNRPNGAGSPPVAAGLAAEAVTGDRGDHAGERADQDASKLAQHQDLDEMTRASASQDRPDSFGPKGPSPTAPVSVGLMLHEVTGPEFEAMLDLLESDQHRPRLAF